jgi:signal transduction histidine kinase
VKKGARPGKIIGKEPTLTLDLFLFLVYFVYGLAFFAMGIAMWLEAGRSPALAEARTLRPLAIFGLLHGTHEWLESYLLQADVLGVSTPAWLSVARLVLLVCSFIFLLLYAVQMLLQVSPRDLRLRILRFSLFGIYALMIGFGAVHALQTVSLPVLDLLDALARYLLAIPAAALATLALRAQARSAKQEGRQALSKSLVLAAVGFGIYALAQLFVRPTEMFPAQYLNAELFRLWAGFPIQLIRACMAILITIALLGATQSVEEERKGQLLAAQQARMEALEQRETLRRELLRHTVNAQEDERGRIARELHDETSQLLSALSLELATLGAFAHRRPQMQESLERLQNLSRQMSQGLYELVYMLRPAQLDDLGLVPALKSLIENEYHPKGLSVTLEELGTPTRFEPIIETVLFRVAQEALTNVSRHAMTGQAYVQLDYSGEQVRLTICDEGRGFDPHEPLHPPRGWGLAGMRERVEAVSGEFKIISGVNKGTTIEVVIPIP